MNKFKALVCLTAFAFAGSLPLVAKEEAPAAPATEKKKEKEIKTIQQALSAGKKQDKLVFIQMGREACGNCQALKKAIHAGKYSLPEKDFVWAEVNCDDPATNKEFSQRFKVKGEMLPFVAITDGKGKVLASSSGFVSKEKFDEMVAKALAAGKKDKAS